MLARLLVLFEREIAASERIIAWSRAIRADLAHLRFNLFHARNDQHLFTLSIMKRQKIGALTDRFDLFHLLAEMLRQPLAPRGIPPGSHTQAAQYRDR